MSCYLPILVLFLAVISLTNGRNYSPPNGIPHIHLPNPPLFQQPIVTPPIPVPGTPHIHPPKPRIIKPPIQPPIPVPSAPHIHPPRPSRPPPKM
uniref:Leguminosin group485 secreted peptide n=1 Tax=Medicago truncatula TaxID=3880 RepID=I3SB97_MEDTR|nr:unknown [Medicago truncatula]